MLSKKSSKNQVDGVLLFNKPIGLSSNKALQKVKNLFNANKAGHAGTLDPLATGLLPICFGEATKFSSFLLEGDKEYIATIKLGQATTTYDAEGEIVCKNEVKCNIDDIKKGLKEFIGEISQFPPLYSAIKVNGKALYKYARSGEEVVIKPRVVKIHVIELVDQIQIDVICVRIVCSKGTYIRTIAHDLGNTLGCGAHLIGLKRIKSNNFELDEGITLESISNLSLDERVSLLLPMDYLVNHLPRVDITDHDFMYIKNGHSILTNHSLNLVRLYHSNKFLGVANCDGALIKPLRMINTSSLNIKQDTV